MISFCENCRELVEYNIIIEHRNKVIKEHEINADFKEAICNICNSRMFVASLRDENLITLINAYEQP